MPPWFMIHTSPWTIHIETAFLHSLTLNFCLVKTVVEIEIEQKVI